MNNRDLLIKKNNNSRLLNQRDRLFRNCIRFGENEGDKHFTAKCVICRELSKLGIDFVTEARFDDNSGRADIFCLNNGLAIEVLVSESLFNIEKKKSKYPVNVEYFKLKQGVTVSDIQNWLEDVLG